MNKNAFASEIQPRRAQTLLEELTAFPRIL